VSSLHVVTGKRVMLAGAVEAGHLAEVLPVAEKAAAVDDRYAHWGKPPMYLVFLAGATEATSWFGGMADGAFGEEFSVGRDDNEVVIKLPPYLFGDLSNTEDSLTEGIATYISFIDNPDWPANPDLPDLTRYVRAGRWSGQCYLAIDITSSDDTAVGAGYDLGYLTIRYLVNVYGKIKMLGFWADVERSGTTLDAAATDVLGTPWASVNAGCATYVHHTVHA
jgi:hypothetical protein